MPYKDIKCRILEEELREFWPQWHVVRQISEGASGAVYEIVKEEYGVEFRSALKVLRTTSGEGISSTATLLQKDDPYGEGYGRNAAVLPGKDLDTDSVRGEESSRDHGMPEEFRNEIKIMETLRGAPNVVTMEDVHFQTDGQTDTLYIRMELLTSLRTYIGSKPALTVPEIIRIGMDVCKALAFCEEKHIIHRDIKPANLFIDEFGTCKVGDFGVSRRSETVHAANMMTGIGTITYMAPEIYYGKPYNNTVDLYALGLVLYQFLNRGRMPFMPAYPTEYTAADIDTSNFKRLHGEKIPKILFTDTNDGGNDSLPSALPAGPDHMDADSAHELDKVIRRACAYRIEDRYRTATEMSSALEACLHHNEGKNKTASKPLSRRNKAAGAGQSPAFPTAGKILIGAVILAAACIFFLIHGSGKSGRGSGSSSAVNNAVPDTEDTGGTANNEALKAEASGGTANDMSSKAEASSRTANDQTSDAEASGLTAGEEETEKDSSASEIEEELSTDWQKVITASEDGTYKESYNIGDTLELDLGEEGTITMELVAMDADELADGSGKAHMTWIAKDLLNTEHAMNATVTNKGDWPDSEMRGWLREDVLPMFPQAVRDNIKEVTKYSYSYSDRGTISSTDSIWIPSRREITGAENTNEDEGTEYTDAYPDDDSRKKRHTDTPDLSWWWLRSASGGYGGSFDNFYDGGSVDSNADYEGGVAIGFCL